MNAKKMFQMTVILAIFALLIVGCSTAAAKEAEEAIEIPASNINFLIGVWEVDIDQEKWRLEMTDDGILMVGREGFHAMGAKGPYTLEGNRLYNEHPSCNAAYDVTVRLEPGAEMPGLHFEAVGEDCLGPRVQALDGKTLYPWPETDFKQWRTAVKMCKNCRTGKFS